MAAVTVQWKGTRAFFDDFDCNVNWDALAYCEAGNRPAALNPSGKYRGMFQFDLSTWASVGGVGDPAAATPAEQLKRAKMLVNARGLRPWGCAAYGDYPPDWPVP